LCGHASTRDIISLMVARSLKHGMMIESFKDLVSPFDF